MTNISVKYLTVGPQEPATVQAQVLNIVCDGPARSSPCVLLAEDASGCVFEVWLAYSNAAVSAARNIQLGDALLIDGHWAKPVCSHRAHNGLHVPYQEIPFFIAAQLRPAGDSA